MKVEQNWRELPLRQWLGCDCSTVAFVRWTANVSGDFEAQFSSCGLFCQRTQLNLSLQMMATCCWQNRADGDLW